MSRLNEPLADMGNQEDDDKTRSALHEVIPDTELLMRSEGNQRLSIEVYYMVQMSTYHFSCIASLKVNILYI